MRSTRCCSSRPSGCRTASTSRTTCESERTVIISELQGGENDPDQLLDHEVTATAFRAHPYRHPTIGWLEDLQSMTPRRPLRPLPPALHPEQRHAGRRRRRRRRRCAAPGRTQRSAASRPAPSAAARHHGRAAADRRAARRGRAPGHDGVSQGRVARAGGDRSRLLPDAGARRRPDRRQGRQPLVELSRPARRSGRRGSTRRWSSAAWPRRSAAPCCRPRSRSSTRSR